MVGQLGAVSQVVLFISLLQLYQEGASLWGFAEKMVA